MVDFVWRDGQRLTPWMNHCIALLDRDTQRLFGVRTYVTSAIRLHQEQINIFTSRYTRTPGSRRVYDTRWWNGALWYRVSSAGTVAPPGSSNHEIQGSTAAVDLRDSGNDGGLATMGSYRSNWLRANAGAYGLVPSGFSFGEAWHYDIPGIYQTVPDWSPSLPAKPTPPPVEPTLEPTLEDLMALKSCVVMKSAGSGYTAQALDFADGFRTGWQADLKYSQTMGDFLTEGGTVLITASHFDLILKDFDRFFADRKAHELAVAKASAGE